MRSGIWYVLRTRSGPWTWIWPTRHCRLWQVVTCWFSMLERCNLLHKTDLITLVQLMWKWMGLFLKKKKHLLRWKDCFFSLLNWGTYIVSVAKTAPQKIGALIPSLKSFTSNVTFYLYKSTIWPCMELLLSHAGMDMQHRLQKWVCRTVGPSLVASWTHYSKKPKTKLF